ncbi:MAG: hypothetical protein QXV22_03880 [Thermoplasmataceae archaeon]
MSDRPKRGVILASIAVAAILIAISIVSMVQHQPETLKVPSGSYSVSSDLVLYDVLSNNSLYGNNVTLTNPPVIYQNISKDIVVDLVVSYTNSDGNSTFVQYSYQAYIKSDSPSWSKISYASNGSLDIAPGDSHAFSFPINVTSNVSIAQKVNEELGLPTTSGYSIIISASATSPFGVSVSNLTLSINYRTYDLSGPDNSPVSGEFQKTLYIHGDSILPITRYEGYAILAIGIGVAAYPIAMSVQPRSDFVTRFKRTNKENLIEISVAPPDDAIRLNSTDDVFRMATFLERPVFSFGNLIYVNDDGKTYYAEIKK